MNKRLHHYEDGLAVTEVEPLIAYLLSSSETRAAVTTDILAQLRAFLTEVIETEGAFHICKDVGMFVAS